jgi:subtilisin-like proprotein convertase family protein
MKQKRLTSNGSKVLASVAVAISILAARGASAGVISIACTDCPLKIPEVGSRGTTISTLEVDAMGMIEDLDIYVDIAHTFTGDLEIFIAGPASNEVQLFDNFGLSGNDIDSVTFDDEALLSISAAWPPFGPGRFRPDPGVLSDFDGHELHGTWVLRIDDLFLGDSGTLLDWSLNATTVPEPSALALLVLFAGASFAIRGVGRSRSRKRPIR